MGRAGSVTGCRKAAVQAAFRLCPAMCGHQAGGKGFLPAPAGAGREWSRPPLLRGCWWVNALGWKLDMAGKRWLLVVRSGL
jgi:hypothetical protein